MQMGKTDNTVQMVYLMAHVNKSSGMTLSGQRRRSIFFQKTYLKIIIQILKIRQQTKQGA